VNVRAEAFWPQIPAALIENDHSSPAFCDILATVEPNTEAGLVVASEAKATPW
jgi:hypothetical protein